MNPIADALLAVIAGKAGDTDGAQHHLADAQRHSQSATRRHRQLIEIAGLVVSGASERASGLALVHTAEFPEDEELLGRMTEPHRPESEQ